MLDSTRRRFRRTMTFLWRLLAYALIWLGIVMLVAGLGIRIFFGRITVAQLFSNLTPETDGGGGVLVWIAVALVGILPILMTGLIAWRLAARRRRRQRARELEGPPETRRQRKDARTRRLPTVVSVCLVLLLVVCGGTALGTTAGIVAFVDSLSSKHTMDEFYKDPQITGSTAKNNLVTIYIESGEQTLTDTSLFEKDPFADLEEATPDSAGWKSIHDFKQYDGGGWTMSGLTATQCGVPLKGAGVAGEKLASPDGSYLNGLTCVGDVLQKQGYTNEFIGGANGGFAGKSSFLASHGYTKEKDLDDWKAAGDPPQSFRSDWGLSDQRLMRHAREEIDQLHAAYKKSGKHFNLSMLTLDSHEPAHIYDYCHVDTKDKVLSMYSCSMTQVAGFVDYMKQKGYLEDTAVVITGDHLKHLGPQETFHQQLDDNPNRSIFNRIWIPGDRKTPLRSGVDQLNMYPTILEATGLELKDHEAGLGVSALAPTVPQGSAQKLSGSDYSDLLTSRSRAFYDKAWGY